MIGRKPSGPKPAPIRLANMSRCAVAIFMLAAAPSLAPAQDRMSDKLCLFSAAQKLPAIPGLTVEGGRIKPSPQEGQKNSDAFTVMVEIDVKAVGQTATYSFLCVTGKQGTFVQALGLSR